MKCDACGAENPDGNRFCGKCGGNIESNDEIALILTRLTQLETKLGSELGRFIEVDLTERVAARLVKWAKLFGIFVGVPATLFVATLVLLTGKTYSDLRDVASSARNSIQAASESAKASSESAKREAEGARGTANEVASDARQLGVRLKEAEHQVNQLSSSTQQRETEAKRLGSAISNSQDLIGKIARNVAQQANEVERIGQEVNALTAKKDETTIATIYPAFGSRVVGGASGWIDSSKKKPGEIYVNVQLAVTAGQMPSIDKSRTASYVSSLQSHGFKVFLGFFGLFVSSGTTSTPLAEINDSQVCLLRSKTNRPPCIVYFRRDLDTKAQELANMAEQVQHIPADQITYSDPKSWGEPWNELILKSGMDAIVVLGSRP